MEKPRKFSWTNYFSNEDNIQYIRKGIAFYSDTDLANYYVLFCLFEECTVKGAIHIYSYGEIRILIEDSVFKSCKSTDQGIGGSVCFNSRGDGQFVQERTCYYKSMANNYYTAFYQNAKTASSYKNFAFEVSVSNCGETESQGESTIAISSGDVNISKINITNNKCNIYSSLYTLRWGNSASCNFSTFRENNQTEGLSLFLDDDDEKIHTVSYCSIIGNICRKNGDTTLFVSERITNVDHCIFLNNTATKMIAGDEMTISVSYIDVKSTSGNINLENLTENYDFNDFTYFYKENCLTKQEDITIGMSYLSKFVKSVSPSLLSSI